VRCAIEVPNTHNIVLVLQYSRFVVVDVKVVRSTEYRHNTREACRSSLPIRTTAGIPGFVGANDGQKVALFEKGASSRIWEVRAAPHMIMDEVFSSLFLSKFFQGIRPKDIAHEAVSWKVHGNDRSAIVSAAIIAISYTYILEVSEGMKLWAKATMQRNCLLVIAANGNAQNDSIHAS
jgi:hypothetical protein